MVKYEWTREELAAQFERVTGESAANYPDAKAIDFLAWIRDHEAEKDRQSRPATMAQRMLAMIEVNAKAMTDEFLANSVERTARRSAGGSASFRAFNAEARAIYAAEIERRRRVAVEAEIRLSRMVEGRCTRCGRPDADGECAICTVSYAPFSE